VTAEPALRANNLRSRIDDWLNPIVVKELRQAVQSRFVVSALLMLLCIQLVAIGVYLLASSGWMMNFDAGRQVFMVLYGILLGVSLSFVPLYTAIRLVSERSDTNVDLLFITTIKPHSIVTGKLFAAIIITILIFSACMPFMAFTYFLRGIDLPSIFVVLALGFLIVVTAAQAAIFVACVPVNRVFKVIFGLIALWVFLITYLSAMAGSSGLIIGGVGSKLGSSDFWEGLIGFLCLFGFLIGLFFVLSVALITPAAANRAYSVRLFIIVAWILIGITALTGSFYEKTHRPVIFWQLTFSSILALGLFVAVSERDQLGRRVRRAIPQSAMKRAGAFFFFSGAASGLAWACLGIGLTLLAPWVWTKLFPTFTSRDDLIESVKWMGGVCLYFFCYALSAAILRRYWLSRISPEMTWLIGLILMIFGIVAPFLIGYLVFFKDAWWSEDYGKWLVGNPFAWSNKSHRTLYFIVGAAWAVIVAVINARWFLERLRSFRPLNPRVDEADRGVAEPQR
jgi:hypothetical protein